MPRTLTAMGIREWRSEQLINDMAVGEKPDALLATEYDVEEQTIRAFRLRRKADIHARKRDLSSETSAVSCRSGFRWRPPLPGTRSLTSTPSLLTMTGPSTR